MTNIEAGISYKQLIDNSSDNKPSELTIEFESALGSKVVV